MDDGAVQRHRFELDTHDLFSLQVLEDPVEILPSDSFQLPNREPAPFAAMLGDIQDGGCWFERLTSALHVARLLSLREFHRAWYMIMRCGTSW